VLKLNIYSSLLKVASGFQYVLFVQGQERQVASEENSQSASTDQGHLDELEALRNEELEEVPSVLPRKNVTRRNAWGQLSYSDLIVRAIESSPDQRATLAMIYEWMIKSIPYFHDKGDSNSSAGWKVNCSLSLFVTVLVF